MANGEKNKMINQTFTLTYGDVCENHVGMEQIGTLCSSGISIETLQNVVTMYPQNATLYHLNTEEYHPPAAILVIKGGIELLLGSGGTQNLFAEHWALEKDTKAFMRGRVVNKIARHNLCFSDVGHGPEYEKGIGTVIPFANVPWTWALRHQLGIIFDQPQLQCEGNYYYDVTSDKVGIGRHGDTERRIVIGARMGASLPLEFYWYYKTKPISPPMRFNLDHGDIYVMSDKAVGYDWKRSSIVTLRHAAGSDRFLAKENARVEALIRKREE